MDFLSKQYRKRYANCSSLQQVVMVSAAIHSGDIQLERQKTEDAERRAIAAGKRAEFLSKELDMLVLQVAAYKLNERKLLEKRK